MLRHIPAATSIVSIYFVDKWFEIYVITSSIYLMYVHFFVMYIVRDMLHGD